MLSPGDVEEAFYLMGAAFNLADKYHTPVIVLSDQHLADSYQTIEPLDPGKVVIDRGDLLFDAGPAYQRYQYTESACRRGLCLDLAQGGWWSAPEMSTARTDI